MKYLAIPLVAVMLAACGPDDAKRQEVKKELIEFVKKCQKNPQDKECVDAADRNSGG